MPQSAFDTSVLSLPSDLQEGVRKAWAGYSSNAALLNIAPPDDARSLNSLCQVWAMSRFVQESCVRDPGLLQDLMESRDLYSVSNRLREKRCLKTEALEAESDLMRLLRRFRRREMVRIAWRDIAGWADLQETLTDLSLLAEICLGEAHDFLYRKACEKRCVPLRSDGRPQKLVILGMGKLGAWELNFSSDIDLIFAYPEEGVLADRKETTYHEFFTRLCQRLVKVLDEITADGFVFRVDTRLRPFGESGPPVMNFDGMESYYQGQAREWERYAMVKARPVAGDFEAGEELMAMLRPFVYRRYLDYGAFAELRGLKLKITEELKRKDRMDNVKLGPGGIREIEFIGQAFQLIRGGREKKLQERRILAVLDLLGKSSLLPCPVVDKLKAAYIYLRKVENRLQEYADQQTHDLPAEPDMRARLAFSMGFNDWSAFKRDLDGLRQEVHEVFDQIFASPQSGEGYDDVQKVWIGRGEPTELIGILGEMGYPRPQDALETLNRFRGAAATRRLTARGAELLDRLMPMLLGAVVKAKNPEVTLKRILDLLEAIAGRNVYLTMLVENPLALSQLVKLACASPWITAYLSRYPILLDGLLDPRTLYAPLTQSELEQQLERQLEGSSENNLEEQMSHLRHFKQASVLRVAAADIMGVIPIMVVSDYLTAIAEVILKRVLSLAWRVVGAKHGVPPRASLSQPSGFGIVAYGKLGGIELGYRSDLDLVFLYDCADAAEMTCGARSVPIAQFHARLGQRIMNILNTNMFSGVLYDVDMRLRPSGNAGLLVSQVNAYESYQENEAWTWEHQALVRARFVAGDLSIRKRFDLIRKKILCKARDLHILRREVREMRKKMRENLGPKSDAVFDLKQSAGGIADIEFIVQFAVLGYARRHEELTRFTDNVRILEGLSGVGILSSEDAETLKRAYCLYRDRGHRETLQGASTIVSGDDYAKLRTRVEAIWRQFIEVES
ncbi:MAG: bifunctional [glutamate--ammonia ligase]-adenylyl-L-tyrosine phosphorylase/[glutamate--ammonia-ligase] adenylyltransferase [Pseudomonadota bacterium]